MIKDLLAHPASASPAATVSASRRWPVWVGVAAVALLAAAHTWAVSYSYHVGSFDDDGQYIALARALANGQGFVDTSLPGNPADPNRVPGYPLLLVPFVALFPDTMLPLRLLSGVLWLVCFPLLWHWLGLRGLGRGTRLAVLALFALSPVAATFATMVMAEMPFLVILLAMLIAMHHWDRQGRALTGWGLASAAALIGLLLVKEAALAFYPAVVGYLLLRRWFRKAVLAGVAGLLVLAPVVANRMIHGVSPLGARNGGYFETYGGNPLLHFLGALPDAAWNFAVYALPNSIVPVGAPPLSWWPGPAQPFLLAVRYAIAPLVVLGFVVWQRRGLDTTLVVGPLYVLQSLAYPFINERRVILILPLVLAWLVVGVRALGAWGVGGLLGRRPLAGRAAVGACLVVLVPLLAVQFNRNYLFSPGMESSKPLGSSYVRALRAITTPRQDIASSYRWTISAFTGRNTLHDVLFYPCQFRSGYASYAPEKLDLLRQHRYAAVLVGALNRPWKFDDPCLLDILERHPAWAVRIHRQPRDRAVVFQLVGPGTANPGLSDVTLARPATAEGGELREEPESPYVGGERAGVYHVLDAKGDRGAMTVTFGREVPVTQVSLGAAGQVEGTAQGIAVQLRRPDGTWASVWDARGADVSTREPGPDVVVRRFAGPRPATAVRVVFRGNGPFEAHDLHVLARTGHSAEPALATDTQTGEGR